MSTQQTDTGKNQPTPLLPRDSQVLNGLCRISAVAGALVFILSSSILLLVFGVKLQQIVGRMGGIRREG